MAATLNDKLLTVAEVAQALRTCETTILRWIKGGALEVVTLPGISKPHYRIKQSTLDAVLGAGAR